jgi:hypothetical protein
MDKKYADQPIYLAFGSNMSKSQMRHRCPDAKPIGLAMLPDWRLVFRGVADIIPAKGYQVPVGLWMITRNCEKRLDVYEGFPNLYRKQYFEKDDTAYMAYVMNREGFSPPPEPYYDGIADGYKDFGAPLKFLEEALDYSWTEQTDRGHWPKRYKRHA